MQPEHFVCPGYSACTARLFADRCRPSPQQQTLPVKHAELMKGQSASPHSKSCLVYGTGHFTPICKCQPSILGVLLMWPLMAGQAVVGLSADHLLVCSLPQPKALPAHMHAPLPRSTFSHASGGVSVEVLASSKSVSSSKQSQCLECLTVIKKALGLQIKALEGGGNAQTMCYGSCAEAYFSNVW